MKKQGKLNLAKHLIGDRRPIVAVLGVSATTLTGCLDDSDAPYTMYTKQSSCIRDQGEATCNARFEAVTKESERTAMKYQAERDCQQDYGDICYSQDDIWSPKIAGFITHNLTNFVLPLYTSTNPLSSHFGYIFNAKGDILDRYQDADGKHLMLSYDLTNPLPTSQIDPMAVSMPESSPVSNSANGETSSTHRSESVISDLANAYIISKAIDGAGEFLTERERTKRYKECMNKGGTDCSSYNVTSGTGRISTSSPSKGTYSGKKPKLSSSQINEYKTQPKVTTISRGGFGSTGSLRGGFGG